MTTIIEDTNNKIGQHVEKNDGWASHGVAVIRNKMPYGDYMLAPRVVVDTKRDVNELCMDVYGDYERFRNAAIRSMNAGTHMVFVVENEDGVRSIDDLRRWVESDESYKLRKKRNANAVRYRGRDVKKAKDGHEWDRGLAKRCEDMYKYDVEFRFCHPSEAWRVVLECLGVVM